jgi:glycosyltransferase involved in cell wall biosynthesis
MPSIEEMSSVAVTPVEEIERVKAPHPVATGMLPVSFVILTYNEAGNIGACLDSLEGLSDDVHVLDSGSNDDTVAIARARGATVHVHPFHGFGSQRNWAIDQIPHRYDWAFHLDADERFTPELAEEVRRLLIRDPVEAGFYVPNKLMLRGKWLRRAGGYPTYQVRLFHRKRLRFADHGHGQREVTEGTLGFLSEPYLHDAFAKGIDDWLKKHVDYALREAEQFHTKRSGGFFDDVKAAFSTDRVRGRRGLKRLSALLPCRSSIRFIEMLILTRALLDGRAGITYARMMAAYEAMIAIHLSARRCGLPAAAESIMPVATDREKSRSVARRRPR